VNSKRFWRAAAIQLAVVAVPFAILAIALSHRFFVDWGFAVGPALWLACSLVTGRLLGLPLGFTLFCAAAGGVAAVLVLLVFGHEVGIVAGIGVFAACASGYERPKAGERERLGAQSSTP
jgi:hypothetical protein